MLSYSTSASQIDQALLTAKLENAAAGAFVAFEGRVRNHNEGKTVDRLAYEVFHDLANAEGARILEEATKQFGLLGALAVHREGELEIGDCAVWIGVTAAHRGEAFDAARYIINAIKHRLPIWKKEHYRDDTSAWVNCQHQDHIHAHQSDARVDLTHYYLRQVRLPEIGAGGQEKLGKAKILVVGVGGLGSAAALNLASAGIGTLGLVEHDVLEVSNLHRQIIYPAAAVGQKKVHAAAAQMRAHNPLISVIEHEERFSAHNAKTLLGGYDLVLDCTDNFPTKYLLNDAAILSNKPFIQASIYRFDGQLLTFLPNGQGGCLRCIAPQAPQPGSVGDCAQTGVLGTVPVFFGTLQANEAIKFVLGLPTPSSENILLFDLVNLQGQQLRRQRNADCPACGNNIMRTLGSEIEPSPLEWVNERREDFRALSSRFYLVDLREMDEAAVIKGTERIPFSTFNPHAFPIKNDFPTLLFCAHGQRSLKAAQLLRDAGWSQVYSVQGGVSVLSADRQAA